MTLKLNVAALEDVPEALREYYRVDGQQFTLDVDGIEDTGALKRAKAHEKDRRKEAEDKLKDAEFEVDKLKSQLEGAGDPDELATLKAQHNRTLSELEEANTKFEGERTARIGEKVDGRIASFAKDKTTAPEYLIPYFRQHLKGDIGENGFQLTPVDPATGQPTGVTADEFFAEFEKNPANAGIIKGSQGSGGGNSNAGQQNGSAPKTDLASMDVRELAAHIKATKQ